MAHTIAVAAAVRPFELGRILDLAIVVPDHAGAFALAVLDRGAVRRRQVEIEHFVVLAPPIASHVDRDGLDGIEIRRLMAGSVAAWIFEGPASWSDVSVRGRALRERHKNSFELLTQAVRDGVMSATNNLATGE